MANLADEFVDCGHSDPSARPFIGKLARVQRSFSMLASSFWRFKVAKGYGRDETDVIEQARLTLGPVLRLPPILSIDLKLMINLNITISDIIYDCRVGERRSACGPFERAEARRVCSRRLAP